MEPIGFFTPVEYCAKSAFSKNALQLVDSFFSIGGWKATVVPGYASRGKEGVILTEYNPSLLSIAWRVALYFTVIVPLVLFAIKCILRATHQFYQIPEKETPAATLFLKAFRGETLESSEDFKLLKISGLTQQKIELQFNRQNDSNSRFAQLPAEEVQKTLYKNGLPDHLYAFITPEQLQGIDYCRLAVYQLTKLLDKQRFEKLAPEVVLKLLYDEKLPPKAYEWISKELLGKVEVHKLSQNAIKQLVPFGLLISDQKVFEEAKSKFACLSKESVQAALYKGVLPFSHFSLVSAAQLEGINLSKIALWEFGMIWCANKKNLIAELLRSLNDEEAKTVIASVSPSGMAEVIEYEYLPERYMPMLTDDQFKAIHFGRCTEKTVQNLFITSDPKVANTHRAYLVPLDAILFPLVQGEYELIKHIPEQRFIDALNKGQMTRTEIDAAIDHKKLTEEDLQHAIRENKVKDDKKNLTLAS